MTIESIINGDLITQQGISMNLALQLCELVFLWKIHKFKTTGFARFTFILKTYFIFCSSAPFKDFPCHLELLLAVALFKMIFTLAQ